MTLGAYLRQRRKELNITQDELAQKAGISQGYVSGLERGINKEPEPDIIGRLAIALDIRRLDLMRLTYPDRSAAELEVGQELILSSGTTIRLWRPDGKRVEVTEELLRRIELEDEIQRTREQKQ